MCRQTCDNCSIGVDGYRGQSDALSKFYTACDRHLVDVSVIVGGAAKEPLVPKTEVFEFIEHPGVRNQSLISCDYGIIVYSRDELNMDHYLHL